MKKLNTICKHFHENSFFYGIIFTFVIILIWPKKISLIVIFLLIIFLAVNIIQSMIDAVKQSKKVNNKINLKKNNPNKWLD